MMEYTQLLISFILGGGLSLILNANANKKKLELDNTQKAIKIWMDLCHELEEKHNNLEARLEKVEAEYKIAKEGSCSNKKCKDRE